MGCIVETTTVTKREAVALRNALVAWEICIYRRYIDENQEMIKFIKTMIDRHESIVMELVEKQGVTVGQRPTKRSINSQSYS